MSILCVTGSDEYIITSLADLRTFRRRFLYFKIENPISITATFAYEWCILKLKFSSALKSLSGTPSTQFSF